MGSPFVALIVILTVKGSGDSRNCVVITYDTPLTIHIVLNMIIKINIHPALQILAHNLSNKRLNQRFPRTARGYKNGCIFAKICRVTDYQFITH